MKPDVKYPMPVGGPFIEVLYYKKFNEPALKTDALLLTLSRDLSQRDSFIIANHHANNSTTTLFSRHRREKRVVVGKAIITSFYNKPGPPGQITALQIH